MLGWLLGLFLQQAAPVETPRQAQIIGERIAHEKFPNINYNKYRIFVADAWETAGQEPLSNKMWFLIPTPWTLAESIKQVPGYQIDAPIIPI